MLKPYRLDHTADPARFRIVDRASGRAYGYVWREGKGFSCSDTRGALIVFQRECTRDDAVRILIERVGGAA